MNDRKTKIELIKVLEEKQRRRLEYKIKYFNPYLWQKKFFKEGKNNKQRLLMAANQIGKSECGYAEVAYHATGLYPDWWEGIQFDFPPVIWVLGKSSTWVRDNAQKKLIGDRVDGELELGGFIPKSLIESCVSGMIPNSVSIAHVKHISNKKSSVFFKSYDQKQHALMGATVDYIMVDEEPKDPAIYPQLLVRTVAANKGEGGYLSMMFTPENGVTNLVDQFMNHIQAGQYLQTATWEDAPHLTESAKKNMLAALPEYQRDMRSKGIPLMGEGIAFPIPDEYIEEAALSNIPSFWPRIMGIDFGYDHPTALVWCAYDRDNDCLHIYDCWKQSKCTPIDVGALYRIREDSWVPVAWPQDGFQHDKGSGKSLRDQYEEQGLYMLREQATFEDGSNGLEAGVIAMLDRMRTGRLKVASHLNEWFEEKRLYHRENKGGKSVLKSIRDDLLSATRYAMMMLRFAETKMPENMPLDIDEYSKRETWY